jgi:hypothetical protein
VEKESGKSGKWKVEKQKNDGLKVISEKKNEKIIYMWGLWKPLFFVFPLSTFPPFPPFPPFPF